MSITSTLRKAIQQKLEAGFSEPAIAESAHVNSQMVSRFLGSDQPPPGVEMVDRLAEYLGMELVSSHARRSRTPNIASAGEVPAPAKRARQTRGLKATQQTASQRGDMKTAGGVAGGVPRPKRSNRRTIR
jgi:transcriptional regulator with XRE-family HTH domain